MPAIRLHDTRSGALRDLEPGPDGHVGIYACGPTVYGRIHVGNARPFVVFSLLRRFLVHEGLAPRLVVNVTDVNDKIYAAARNRVPPTPSADLAAEMTAHYIADTDALGLGRPDAEPRAAESIEAIVDLIAALIERDHAYAVEGDVFFRVRHDTDYGCLSRRRPDDMNQGEGVEGADRKEDPLDFALWKAAKPDEDTSWDAPWGAGRPGWHIECSAMAEQELGVGFQIHGGGSDLVFPHHENEAAQTRMGRGAELAGIWMHSGMLQIGQEKMAKSVGNMAPLHEVLGVMGRDALLMLFSSAHYRQPMAFDPDRQQEAAAQVARLRETARKLVDGESPADMRAHRDAFFAALAEDFNTATALRGLWAWVREANRRTEPVGRADLVEMLGVLGLEDVASGAATGDGPDAAALELLEARDAARAAKDFGEADRLRDELRASGWEVRDGPDGAELIGVGS